LNDKQEEKLEKEEEKKKN